MSNSGKGWILADTGLCDRRGLSAAGTRQWFLRAMGSTSDHFTHPGQFPAGQLRGKQPIVQTFREGGWTLRNW